MVEQADDGYRSQRLSERLKSAMHDGHATECALRNYYRVTESLLQFDNRVQHVTFHMCRRGKS